MTVLRLWWEFFKIGMFSVGGGMATLPFLYDMSDRTGWFTYDMIADMLAVSESTPGPIGINMATYTGYVTAGIPGSVAATLGVITPGIIIVLLIVAVLDRFRKNKYVEAAFYGLRPASTGLIAAAGVLVVQIALLNVELYKQSNNFSCGVTGAYKVVQAYEKPASDNIHSRLSRCWHTDFLKQNSCSQQCKCAAHKSNNKPSDYISGGFYIRAADY